MKWETACMFSTCVIRRFLYLDTDSTLLTSSFASLNVTFLAYFKSVIKISKGFKKWNCFRKTGLNTSLIVSIVGTETSVTKVISRKYKFHVLKWKMLISLSHQKFQCYESQLFSLVVVFNLTSFWVRDNSISLSEYRNLVNIRIMNYSLSCLQPSLWRTLSACLVLLWCLLQIIIFVNVPPTHWSLAGQKIAFLFAKLCC